MSATETIKPQSQKFSKQTKGDTIILSWRAWLTFFIILGALTFLNVMLLVNAVNEKRVPMWFISYALIVSGVLVLFVWLTTTYRLTLMPDSLTYRGGWRTLFERTVSYKEIQTLYLKSVIDGSDGDSDPDYVVIAELTDSTRVRLSNPLSKPDAEFVRSQISKYVGGSSLSRAQPFSRAWKLLNVILSHFPFCWR